MGFMDKIKSQGGRKQKFIPVILLLDVSGSMRGENIDSLNEGVKLLLDECANPKFEKPIKVAIITFGEEDRAKLHQGIEKAHIVRDNWQPMYADMSTPLGEALQMAHDMVDDPEYLPNDEYYKPYFVLASDGKPNRGWESAMNLLLNHPRAKSYERFSIAIGSDADEVMLDQFKTPGTPLYHADDGAAIVEAFKTISGSIANTASGKNKGGNAGSDKEKTASSAKKESDFEGEGFI